ncbi:hypothetical protein J3F83DRAFT_746268 [Trichoderma novae-zelandiae]
MKRLTIRSWGHALILKILMSRCQGFLWTNTMNYPPYLLANSLMSQWMHLCDRENHGGTPETLLRLSTTCWRCLGVKTELRRCLKGIAETRWKKQQSDKGCSIRQTSTYGHR